MRGFISSLINITLSLDVPFYQPQQLLCLHPSDTFVITSSISEFFLLNLKSDYLR